MSIMLRMPEIKASANGILIFFLFFISEKLELDIFHALETICMKCQFLF